MKFNPARLLVTLLPLFCYTAPALAESLSEHDIRSLYTRMDSVVHDAQATRKIMDANIDPAYMHNAQETLMSPDQPSVVNQTSKTKAQMIEASMNGFTMAKIDKYERKITDIKFTQDKNWAYVYNDIMTSGETIRLPAGDGNTFQLRYVHTASCVDTIALREGVLKLMRSDCKETNKLWKM